MLKLYLSSCLLSLALGGIFLAASVETQVYYVKPANTSKAKCPGEPCHTLHHYEHQNWTEGNITLLFMPGEYNTTGYPIESLRNGHLKLIGMEPAYAVVMYIIYTERLYDASAWQQRQIYFENMTFISRDDFQAFQQLSGNYISLVGLVYNRVYLSLFQSPNCSIVLENSNFTSGGAVDYFRFIPHPEVKDTRVWNITGCHFNNVSLSIGYMNMEIIINDSSFTSMRGCFGAIIDLTNSNLLITGNTIFSDGKCTPLGVLYTTSSSVMITGNVTFSNYYQSAIIAHVSNIIIVGNSKVIFKKYKQSAIILHSSNVTLSGKISFHNNTGVTGGAMAFIFSMLYIDRNSHIEFFDNHAMESGGALYVEFDPVKHAVYCFYQFLNYTNYSNYALHFRGNSAYKGGEHIYGEYMHSAICSVALLGNCGLIGSYDVQKFFKYSPDHNSSLSPVSSDPLRVCICNHDNKPQCLKDAVHGIKVYPGEQFTLPAVVVGADFGATLGPVHAILDSPAGMAKLKYSSQYAQWITNRTTCSKLNYAILSRSKHESLYLTVKDVSLATVENDYFMNADPYSGDGYCNLSSSILHKDNILTKPLLVNITLLGPCPPGFTLTGNPPSCECNSVLKERGLSGQIINQRGYISWDGPMWVNASQTDVNSSVYYDVLVAQYCPANLCKMDKKNLSLRDDPDIQCAYNHAGRLCGSCKENYSLAIGSSHCINCPNNNSLALLVFFVAAGFLLVLFINVSNLTVAQGVINGLILYANIMWTYQSILFPAVQEDFVTVLKVFLAWLNLDFGIQSCFIDGLNAFWKTWLQYAFPVYIWMIALIIIVGAKHSVVLTKLIGNKAVPVLATLLLLSYTKLLRTIIASVAFTPIQIISGTNNSTFMVWSLDGQYDYCHFPHIFLFLVALFALLVLWIPYTLLLLLVKWLRKMSHLKLFKWISKLNPIFDAYFAPLKDKHHYWFGVLLLVRGMLLIIFTTTYTVLPNINLLILLIISALLLCYSNYKRIYKSKVVQLLENFFLLILIFVGGAGLFDNSVKHIVAYISVGAGFIIFCGLVIWSTLTQIFCKGIQINREHNHDHNNIINHRQHEQAVHEANSNDAQFRDSILEETQPLIHNTNTY